MYSPNGELECDQCSTRPTVQISDPELPFAEPRQTLLCGVCFFQDRLMIDPDFWNEEPEATE